MLMNDKALIEANIEEYLDRHERKELLRFVTVGSVDDGKSTLIGRLLRDTGGVYEDQLAAVKKASGANAGSDGIDLALITDGLKAEREQGITIDVAYRYFTTAARKFIIADTPGHEQYTRNMATGASTAELAVILIDARLGVLAQTRRHSFIATQLGIRQLVVAINKMDLVDYSEARFEEIKRDYLAMAQRLPGEAEITFIPVSALAGTNVVERNEATAWYTGKTLLEHLETVPIARGGHLSDVLFPVQFVIRPNLDFRGYTGTLAGGTLKPGQEIQVLPSGEKSRVAKIHTYDGDLDEAFPPQSIVVTLEDEIDISRGDVLADPSSPAQVGSAVEAMVVWMDNQPLQAGRQYLIKHLTSTVPGTIGAIRYQVDVNTLEHQDTDKLELNGIGKVAIQLNRPLVFDTYESNRQAGAFIIIDRASNSTVGAGMITRGLQTESDTTRRLLGERGDDEPITGAERAGRFNQRPATVWLRGRQGSGKLALARRLEQVLFDAGYMPYLLDLACLSVDIAEVFGFTGDEKLADLRRAVAMSRMCREVGLVTIALVDADADTDAIEVYLETDDQAKVAADVAPDVLIEDASDTKATADNLYRQLRDANIVGYFRGDDIVSI